MVLGAEVGVDDGVVEGVEDCVDGDVEEAEEEGAVTPVEVGLPALPASDKPHTRSSD